MLKRIVSAVLCTVTMTGCYFGRSPTAKIVAYSGNGALVGLGILNASGTRDSDETNVGHTIGAIAIAAGVLGTVLNLALTDAPAPAFAPTAHHADGNAASITY